MLSLFYKLLIADLSEEDLQEEEIEIQTVAIGEIKSDNDSSCPICMEPFDQFFKQVIACNVIT